MSTAKDAVIGPRSRAALWTGRATLPQPALTLRAGPVTALLDGADLRHVRLGDVELVQRAYVAVRDAPWNTIPAVYRDWVYAIDSDRFRVTFSAGHRHEDIWFEWLGAIEGTPDGTISYAMDGRCKGVFKYSKIGFNIHHALAGTVGRQYRATTAAGTLEGVLPQAIDPQRIVDGTLSGMFEPYSELAIRVVDGTEAVVRLDGDLLELQDHRNWTDANFKSYATPLALGFPFDSSDGQVIHQELHIGWIGTQPAAASEAVPEIRLGPAIGPLPALGLGMASHAEPISASEATLLRQLKPDHLRVDLVMRAGEYEDALAMAVRQARQLETGLELAVSANESSEALLAELAERLAGSGVPVARVLVYALAEGFSAMLSTTPVAIVALVSSLLRPAIGAATVAGGTNQNFSDVNRDRPTDPVYGGVCFSVSPTVHAADDGSVMENIAGQAEVVGMARTFRKGIAVCVSPVTIATRFGPYPAGPAAPGGLPAAVDVRQASLLGAAWTVGSIAALATSGASSATYYETTGWRGIVERDGGSPMPASFPSRPADVFPMFHVFADVAQWKGGTVRAASSSDALRVVAFAVSDPAGATHLLVANVTPGAQRTRVSGLPGLTVRVRVLDEASAEVALADPAAFRARPGAETAVHDGTAWLELGPYAVARVDAG